MRRAIRERSPATTWCWGQNTFGQVGDGSFTNRLAPVQVGAAVDWAGLETGFDHACGVRGNGTLWCWGTNGNGQLGDGSTTSQPSPSQVGSDTDWSAVTAGAYETCALKSGGTLWCWGYGYTSLPGRGRGGHELALGPLPFRPGLRDQDGRLALVLAAARRAGSHRDRHGVGRAEPWLCAADERNDPVWHQRHAVSGCRDRRVVPPLDRRDVPVRGEERRYALLLGDRPVRANGTRRCLTRCAGGAAAVTRGARC